MRLQRLWMSLSEFVLIQYDSIQDGKIQDGYHDWLEAIRIEFDFVWIVWVSVSNTGHVNESVIRPLNPRLLNSIWLRWLTWVNYKQSKNNSHKLRLSHNCLVFTESKMAVMTYLRQLGLYLGLCEFFEWTVEFVKM